MATEEGCMIEDLAAILASSSPVVFAALGETITERSGVVNLSVEGTMLLGAMVGFAAAETTGSLWVGFAAAALVGAGVALIVALGSISLRQDQVAIGFVMTLVAADLSSFLGAPWVRIPGPAVRPMPIPGLSDLPVVGPLFFDQDPVTYASFLLIIGTTVYFYATQPGLKLRGTGERPAAAFVRGVNVKRVRYVATLFGGALVGVGGAAFSLWVKLGWSQGATSNFGWIALAIVIFGGWNPLKVAGGAYLFGALRSLAITMQSRFPAVPVQLFPLLPFPLMIFTLVIANSRSLERLLWLLPTGIRRRVTALVKGPPPAGLGVGFEQD
jgi:simple sugar transport system permease protein